LLSISNEIEWKGACGTVDKRLCFGGDKPTSVGYSGSNMTRDIDSRLMAGDIDFRKSTSGYLIKFAGEAMT